MIRTILAPLDGSELAERALPEARRLAREEAAVIVLVRVVRTAPSGDLLAYDAAVTAAEEYLDRLAAQLRRQGLTVRTDVFVSDPAEAIALAALVHGAGVIVMSTHGRSGLGRVVLGSVAETVLQEANVPVLLVRADREPNAPPASPTGPYRKVLIPLDGTAPAEDALRYVAGHAVTRDAEVLLVHSEQATALPVAPGVWGYTSPLGLAQAEEETQRRCDEIRAYLNEMARLYLGGHTTHTYVTIGDPGEAILHIAQDHGVDMIVMATHARHGLDYVIHGSVARHVLHYARVPMLFLHRTDAPLPAPWATRPEIVTVGR
jgi:nucleotide-binding universal stress UspA family protein